MKIRESYWHEASKADKKDKPNWADESRRKNSAAEQTDAANKPRQAESALKEETKFSSLLDSPARLQKPGQQRDNSSEDGGGEDRREEKKQAARDKDAAESLREGRSEKHESFGGSPGGGGGAQSGFGAGAGVSQLHLSENFAARSILHIADLERLISTIRVQMGLGGRREIVLQLKRSVLEGLRVKILTDPGARVQIEFLAANEKVRSEIERHGPELAEILRGRGINLGSLKTSLEQPESSPEDVPRNLSPESPSTPALPQTDELSADNTFADPREPGGKIYNA